MKAYYARELTILPSMCDSAGKLSVPNAFSLFMDVATEHAERLGIGMDRFAERGLFWLTVRTRLRFIRRPAMNEVVTASTWPETPERSRCNRDYRLEANGETLIEGKTEWMIMNLSTGRLFPVDGVFPADMEVPDARVLEEPFMRMTDDFAEADAIGGYTVRSTDIDVGGHMNNAAYVRAIAGLFTAKAWQEMNIREMEVAFRAPCFEGNALMAQKRRNGDAIEIRLSHEGKTIVLARIK